ncbi:MAG: hypothetical protein QM539_04400 [Alphaproteobacteria bacterium]|nr:hypothetical protein [Alphaproteobacteria bacterium]
MEIKLIIFTHNNDEVKALANQYKLNAIPDEAIPDETDKNFTIYLSEDKPLSVISDFKNNQGSILYFEEITISKDCIILFHGDYYKISNYKNIDVSSYASDPENRTNYIDLYTGKANFLNVLDYFQSKTSKLSNYKNIDVSSYASDPENRTNYIDLYTGKANFLNVLDYFQSKTSKLENLNTLSNFLLNLYQGKIKITPEYNEVLKSNCKNKNLFKLFLEARNYFTKKSYDINLDITDYNGAESVEQRKHFCNLRDYLLN